MAALIVVGQCGAETIADNNSKTIHEYEQGNIIAHIPPTYLIFPVKQHEWMGGGGGGRGWSSQLYTQLKQ